MFSSNFQGVKIFIILCFLLVLILITFVLIILYRYQQKQNIYFKEIEEIKGIHENNILQAKLEIQEQTFQNISREIHDNIGQKLTLAKLNLNTIGMRNEHLDCPLIIDSIDMIGEAITDLSDISRSMSSELVSNNGLISALEYEVKQLKKSEIFLIYFLVNGESFYLEQHTELELFRIAQEALNNIVKHSKANIINIQLAYNIDKILLEISDNGQGFVVNEKGSTGIGLSNIKKRTETMKGKYIIDSTPGKGTILTIEIPYYEGKSKM